MTSRQATGGIEVLRAGPLSTVQDLGRRGYRHLGVAQSGALDSLALEVGNRLVGNRPDAAAIEITLGPASFRFPRATRIAITGTEFGATLDGAPIYSWWSDMFHVFCQGVARAFEWRNLLAHAADSTEGEGRLTAPMPGKVIAVLVEPGQKVEQGDPLIVMEAMKMEHTIGAPAAGVVGEVLYAVGDQVADGAQLLVMTQA